MHMTKVFLWNVWRKAESEMKPRSSEVRERLLENEQETWSLIISPVVRVVQRTVWTCLHYSSCYINTTESGLWDWPNESWSTTPKLSHGTNPRNVSWNDASAQAFRRRDIYYVIDDMRGYKSAGSASLTSASTRPDELLSDRLSASLCFWEGLCVSEHMFHSLLVWGDVDWFHFKSAGMMENFADMRGCP